MINLTERERIALEMAASGNISGESREWPILLDALHKCGVILSPAAEKPQMIHAAVEALAKMQDREEERRVTPPHPGLIGALSEDRRKPSETQKEEINFTFSYPFGNGFEGEFVASIESLLIHEISKPPAERLLGSILKSKGPYVNMNRGRISGQFLNSSQDSHLVMIDPDIGFPPNILELFKAHIEENRAAHIIAGRVDLGNGLPVFYTFNSDRTRTHQPFPFTGLKEFDLVGTGIICISRVCLTQMYKHFGSVAHFFHHEILDGVREMGDDFSFCLHAKECGYKIFGAWDIFGQHYKVAPVRGIYPDFQQLVML